jgi:hypothetical protein
VESSTSRITTARLVLAIATELILYQLMTAVTMRGSRYENQNGIGQFLV